MRFSIVTPTRNSEQFLGQTIESVVSQEGDFEIQYVIVDAQSRDATPDIVDQYRREFLSPKSTRGRERINLEFMSGADAGMYDAINRGFARCDGDIFAYINSDDVYLPGAFSAVSRAFLERPEVAWLKGITTYIDEASEQMHAGACFLYDRRWLAQGLYGPMFNFVQQDSVFWRRSLWQRSGGLDASLRLSGDYDLWRRFARYEPMYSLARRVSSFRRRAVQLSSDIESYWREAAIKGPLPGRDRQRLLARALHSPSLPRTLRLAMRRATLGAPDYRFIASRDAVGTGASVPAAPYAIDDRVTCSVLLPCP